MPSRPLLFAFLTVLGGFAGTAICADPQGASVPSFLLIARGDRLTVQLDRVPLRLVLSELTRVAGIRCEFPESAGNTVISEAFANLPLEQGIARLLNGHSFMVAYQDVVPIPGAPRQGPIKQLWVVSSDAARESATASQTSTARSAARTAAVQDPGALARLQALEQWSQSRQVTLRDRRSMDPVTHALVDPDEQVRARAQEIFDQAITSQAVVSPAPDPAGAATK
ncbi:MAG TPA: hypothetical protein VKF40_03435 [Burkholderiales bacterium]|nr:hypothetical protein [Burkholderiales bacterium]